MKLNRKHLTTLVATLLIATLTHYATAHDFEVDGIYYCINGTNATVTYKGTYSTQYLYEYNDSVMIPTTVTYNGTTYSVTSIGDHAFQSCIGLTSVTIPNSVTSIGEYAFSGCSGLKSVTIPNSVTSIGNNAFQSCKGLTSVTIPNSVTAIGNEAFYGCSGLTSVTIPNSVTSIGNNAFYKCSSLTSITIPNSVTAIGNEAFYGCSGLTSVTIPNSVTSIGSSTFLGCSGLTSVTIPNSVTKIGSTAFSLCKSLTSITIPNSVTTIGERAFSDCSGLTTINWNAKSCTSFTSNAASQPFNGLTGITTFDFGNEVETIPAYLCYGLIGLTNITVPSSVSTIGDNTFGNCTGIKTLTWDAIHCISNGNMPTSNIESVTISNSVQSLPNNFVKDSKIATISIPNSVTSIGNNAFQGCSGLTSITIPNSVTSIGKSAFYGCSGLTSVTIPNSVTSISPDTFNSCSGLTSVTIPNSVTSIWGAAFSGCSALKSVTIPNSVTTIGNKAFCGCSGLTGELVIPNSVTSIDNDAFYGCSGLTSITIPNSVTSISNSTFEGCSGLTSVTIPNSVTKIGEHAFSRCSGLTSITIPNSVTSFGEWAFSDCSGLINITIGKSISSISRWQFNGCTSVKNVLCLPQNPPSTYPSANFTSNPTVFATSNYSRKWGGGNVVYRVATSNNYTTATFYSERKESSHFYKLRINNQDYIVTNDSITLSGLQPNEQYTAIAYSLCMDNEVEDSISITTKNIVFASMAVSTQTSITPKFKVYCDSEFNNLLSGVNFNGKVYDGTIAEKTDNYYIIETSPIKDLNPNTNYYFTPWIVCNGKRCEGPQYNITTQNIGTSSNAVTGPTNVEMTASYNAGDATVKDAYFTFNGQQMKKIVMTGLRPSTTYSTVYTVVTNNGKINTNMSFKTKSLTMTTQEARMLSDTSPMLIAETNMADVETSCGFEWRRYDAPEEMPSAKVYCPVYGGTMAGVLKNMSPNVYYKYRPFYKASDGSEYYGNWIAFITADAGVTFEPVVYTYKAPEVTQNTATLQGVALPGSSEITEQGFEYWRMNGSKAPTGTVNKVTATGQRMSATVQGLNAGATYGYRSYVKAGGQTYYGSEEQFTTEKPTGDVNGDSAVNVSDVTTLVNMILGVIPKDNTRADIDGNGTVNVSDVTALVNLILGIH